MPMPDQNLTGKPPSPLAQNLSPLLWVDEQVAEAEKILWRKTCNQCHTLSFPKGASLPEVAPPSIPVKWMVHAAFDHNAHRMMTCTSCHAGATTSQLTSDVLLPGIQNCRQCHRPGLDAAESAALSAIPIMTGARRNPSKADSLCRRSCTATPHSLSLATPSPANPKQTRLGCSRNRPPDH